MLAADAIIANLTPFRGLSADVGTVFELGFMRGRGKPCFTYSNVTATHYRRLVTHYDGRLVTAPGGESRGPDGLLVDDFEMNENLMLDGAVAASGGAWVTRDVPADVLYADTTTFEAVLRIAS
jgi:nucleoside 2-deoxyribosyltransferase